MAEQAKHVRVGETDYKIAPFRAYKAFLAGRAVARVSDEISAMTDRLADYNAEYREKHKLRITRELAEARADVDPGYKALLEGALKSQPFVELPQAPSFEEQMLVIFSQAFEFASAELMQVIALALIPNSELRGAWREDDVFHKLEEYGAKVFEEAGVGELIDLAVTVNEVVREDLAPRMEALGKLRALYGRAQRATEGASEAETQTETSTTPSPPSFTGSDGPSDGQRSTSSLSPLGAGS